jgi:threonine dehydratase
LLAERCGAEVWVKHENHTPTGAFKLRGGLIYAARLKRERPEVAGIISATRGNHGQSLAWAGRCYGIAVTIVVPHSNSVEKNAAMRAFGAELIEHGVDFEAAREAAGRLAVERELEFAPSFAPDLVKGVATYSLELFRGAPELDALYVPIGLGSGICGAIFVRDLLGLRTEIIGVQSAEPVRYAGGWNGGASAGPGGVRDHPARGLADRVRFGQGDRWRDPGILDRYA